MSPITKPLLQLDCFKARNADTLPQKDRIRLAYHRARTISRAYGFTTHDVVDLTPKFWAFHRDLINPYDMAAFTLMTIQYNLAAGTLAPFLPDRPDLKGVMGDILNFDVSAQFLLTEVGHGLDARNLETTATLLPDGGFEMNTPHKGAAKYMPPTAPQPGFPRVAIVIARLKVANQDKGLRPFLVWLNDGYKMNKGVSVKVLPRRTGAKPLDHSITTFSHVQLPSTALLGPLDGPRPDFHQTIQRVHVGTLALTTTLIPILKRAVYVAARYSLRRCVGGGSDRGRSLPKPIISFRTQQRPILHALAQVSIWEAFADASIKLFTDPTIAYPVRHGVAATFKAVLTQGAQSSLFALSERCGAQGLFEYNHIIENQLEARGISIAEGDTLVLCIRLATELLLNRYALPPPTDPTSLLAKYEFGMYTLCRTTLASLSASHRGEAYNTLILPHAQPLIESIGHRMAYEAARAASVDEDLLAIYEASVLFHAPAWYANAMGLDVQHVFEQEGRAMDEVLNRLEEVIEGMKVEVAEYCTAPILGDREWEEFVGELEGVGGIDGREDGEEGGELVRSML
ncbi:acyl-CoA dehydrogenase NM domain-like protein [Aspergillus granulosus]|uniref:Acyl-CoA dehydrogenase NM domain-like protein n=1 Tax=Aspergillus granulosus TaxID=176169 RepID=A0ABR4H8H6_9EURO